MRLENQAMTRRYRLRIMLYAAIIGLIAGAMSILFHYLVDRGTEVFTWLTSQESGYILLSPFVVYALLYLSSKYFLDGDDCFGAAAVERELSDIEQLLLRPHKVIVKMINTIVALAGGFAVGQFGPTLHIGGAIGSNVGYYFKMPRSVIRVLVGCGVAAALSAIMHAPLFAAIFVIEVIYAKRYFDYMLPVLLSSLVAYSLDRQVMGDYRFLSLESLPTVTLASSEAWLVIIALATGLGLVAGCYVMTLRWGERLFKPKRNQLFILAGLAAATALIYAFFPTVVHLNLQGVRTLFSNGTAIGVLFVILVIRLLLTAVQLGSGIYGGNFSPGLTVGILFGAIFTKIMALFGLNTYDFETYMALSIVGILSGFAHAPISAVVLVLELSGEHSITIPAMVIALISYFVSAMVVQDNVYNLK